jgi:cytochrome c-type biogenesis protein CcmH/NrfG
MLPVVSRLSTPFAVLLILATGLAAYSNSLAGSLVFDDWTSLVVNPYIRSLRTALSAPPDSTLAGRPVVSLTFAANMVASGGSPGPAFVRGARAVNVAIHLAAALALFGVVRRTLRSRSLAARFGPVATPVAAACSMLWVAHPLTTAAVTYIVQRAESLMGLMYLLTLYCAIRAWTAGARARLAWTAASVASCAAGMGCKEVMVSAPLVVGLHDALFSEAAAGSSSWRQRLQALWRLRWPLYGALAATWIFLAALIVSNPRPRSVGIGVDGWSSWLYLKTQSVVIVHYLGLAVWPARLSIDRAAPMVAALSDVLFEALFLSGLVVACAVGVVRRAPWAFAGAWFFLILAPSSSVLPIATEVAAEHRMYLPIAGLVSLAVVVWVAVLWRLTGRAPGTALRRTGAVLTGTLVIALVGTAVVVTRHRNEEFRSEDALWAAATKVQPGNARAQANLGAALLRQGRYVDAEGPLRLSLALRPDDPDTLSNLGSALCGQGRLPEGIDWLERALQLSPDFGEARFNLGEALLQSGRTAEALAAYRQVLRQAPDSVRTMKRVVALLASDPHDEVRDGRLAVEIAERLLVATNGGDVDALDLLAAAYAETGRMGEAARVAQIAAGLARKAGREDQAGEIEERVSLYRSGRPYRRPVR